VALPVLAATPPPGYNKLQDIWVFKDALNGTWSGGDLIAPGGNVPIDTNQMHDGLPVPFLRRSRSKPMVVGFASALQEIAARATSR
jgi:hypothetical protein